MDKLCNFQFIGSHDDYNSEHFDSVLRSMRLYVEYQGDKLPMKYLGLSLFCKSDGSVRPLFSFKVNGLFCSLTMASVMRGRISDLTIYYVKDRKH